MALDQDDVRIPLKIEPDLSKLEDLDKIASTITGRWKEQLESLTRIREELDKSAQMAKTLGDVSLPEFDIPPGYKEFTQGVYKNIADMAGEVNKINFGMQSGLTVEKSRADALLSITKEMESQEKLLARMKVLEDPKNVKEKVAREKELNNAEKRHKSIMDDERKRQGIPVKEEQGNYQDIDQVVGMFRGFLSGGVINVVLNILMGSMGRRLMERMFGTKPEDKTIKALEQKLPQIPKLTPPPVRGPVAQAPKLDVGIPAQVPPDLVSPLPKLPVGLIPKEDFTPAAKKKLPLVIPEEDQLSDVLPAGPRATKFHDPKKTRIDYDNMEEVLPYGDPAKKTVVQKNRRTMLRDPEALPDVPPYQEAAKPPPLPAASPAKPPPLPEGSAKPPKLTPDNVAGGQGAMDAAGVPAAGVPAAGALGVAGVAVAIAAGVGVAIMAVQKLFDTVISTVAVASPAMAKIWQMTIEDISGVIGQTLMPVMEILQEGARFFGDVLATILPSIEEMGAAMAPLREAWDSLRKTMSGLFATIGPMIERYLMENVELLGELMKTFADYMADLVPLIEELIPAFTAIFGVLRAIIGTGIMLVFKTLATVMSVVVKVVTELVKAFNAFMGPVYQLLQAMGIMATPLRGKRAGMEDSTGAAAREARISDVSSFLQQLQTEAFRQPGATTNYPAQTVSTLSLISQTLTSIFQFMEGTWGIIAPVANIGGGVVNTGVAVGSFAMNPIGTIIQYAWGD